MRKLEALMFSVDDVWIVQCLQADIAAQGATIAAAREAFALALAAQVALAMHHGEEPLGTFQPAPPVFWERFSQAADAFKPRLFDTPSLADVPPAFQIPQLAECRVDA